MPFIKSVRIDVPADRDLDCHPYDVASIAAMIAGDERLLLHRAVTFFVGDNGSGKSTLLEAIAVNQGLNPEGGSRHMRFRTHERSVSELHRDLRVSRSSRRPDDAFFLRAESYFNVATAIEEFGSVASYGTSPHQRSHGESFIDLLVHRFAPNGLYLLDEPEARVGPTSIRSVSPPISSPIRAASSRSFSRTEWRARCGGCLPAIANLRRTANPRGDGWNSLPAVRARDS